MELTVNESAQLANVRRSVHSVGQVVSGGKYVADVRLLLETLDDTQRELQAARDEAAALRLRLRRP